MTIKQIAAAEKMMTNLYRACDGYDGSWSCWTPERTTVEAYRDNPGYGGSEIAQTEATGRVLDIRGSDGRQQLADALADALDMAADDLAREWQAAGFGWCYEVWENSKVVRTVLSEQYDWVCHTEETYPEGAETWVRIN